MEYILFKTVCRLFMSKEQFAHLRMNMYKYLGPIVLLLIVYLVYGTGCEHGFTWKPLNSICYKM